MGFWYSVFIFSKKNMDGLWKKNWAGLMLILISIAALIHDLGHGPFSHLFDNYVTDTEHEYRSIEIFKKSNFKKGELNISNIEIFNALVERLTLARRWKDRIKRHFCREVYFNQLF